MDTNSLRDSLQDALDDLSSSRSSPGRKTRALAALEHLLALVCIAAHAEGDLEKFMQIQDTFECNIPSRLLSWISISTLRIEALTSKGSLDPDREIEITNLILHLSQCLSIIQGVTLHHKPSKRFLGRKYALEVLLDLLLACRHLSSPMPLTTATTNTPGSGTSAKQPPPGTAASIPLSSVVLDTLMCILVDSPKSLRALEDCSGVQTVVKILKTAGTPREVRMKCLEFLYFYLMDETSSTASLNGILPFQSYESIDTPASPTKTPSSPAKRTVVTPSSPIKPTGRRVATPSLPTKTAPTTPSHTRAVPATTASPSKPKIKTTPFTPATKSSSGLSSSSSSARSKTWGSISSFSSDLSNSTSTTAPEEFPVTMALPDEPPRTPPRLNSISLATSSNEYAEAKTPQRPRPLVLRKDVDIDYEPISPKKPKIARVGTHNSMPGSKVRELRELSTGSRSMPVIPNGTSTKGLFGTPRHHGRMLEDNSLTEEGDSNSGSTAVRAVRTAEEKKEILGSMLGNVDALVEGVRKAGIWGLG